jgi:hypothetical protein
VGNARAASVALSRDRLVSQRRLVQAGSLAAAIASILGLVFTVGDGVTGLFAHSDSTAHVQIDDVSLEKMSLRTFLSTKKAHVPGTPFGYTKQELDDQVLVADVRARYAHSSRGVPFPVKLSLQGRGADGSIHEVDAASESYVLDAGQDSCGCSEYFRIPQPGREYRVELQILRPNAPTSEPLGVRTSSWYRF